MNLVNLPIKCSECGEINVVRVNLFNGKFEILKNPAAPIFTQMNAVVDHYKKVKGYDQIPTWDGLHRKRAMKAAKRLLKFLRVEDPVGVSIECINDVADRALRERWTFPWTLETVVKLSPDWLAAKNGARK